MPAETQTIRSIFLAAVENRTPNQWPAFLEEVCKGDANQRREVENLLQAHVESNSLLDNPESKLEATICQLPPERPGTQIGRYKLLEQVGEGGMGVVYVAEQTEPVRRRVALKIIKPGMDTKQVIARFEAERQALAMMDHPNIARVLDAGTTEAGRPYFVMELVRGMPITEYCDKVKLTPRQRLELFVDVCQAVQHAHQKGIIHRDLKPSNVMITLHDGTPVVKVIDFGVAKAVGQQLTERTIYTALTQLVGTPLYMSPEQAEMSGLDVDTRSDVYSLGVLLYELLTGQTPFDKETLSKAGLDEMRRIIREDEPLRPSRRFSTLGAQAISTISQHRSLDERRLSKILCGELDWIVMKALEKDRSRRYESASALATDIQRYLSDEPVLACPPTTMYRFQKFARKHKPAIATAAAVALCLILGTTVSAWQAVRATTAEAQASANEAQAKASAQKAEAKTQEATTQRDEAQKQRDEVKALADRLQRTLYAANMKLAKQAWEEADVSQVLNLLQQHRPKPGEPDLRGFEWHYLNRLCHADDPLLKLNGSGQSVSFRPDGKHLVGVSSGGTSYNSTSGTSVHEPELKVRDAQTGQELFKIKVGYDGVVFSPDGKRLAFGSGTWDDTKKVYVAEVVKVWDAQTGQELLTLKGHIGNINSVAFSSDGKRLASGSGIRRREVNPGEVGEVKVWDSETGQELLSFKDASGDVRSLAFSPDGKRLAYGIGGGLIARKPTTGAMKVCDAQTGQELLSLQGGSGSVAFSPDGKRLASTSYRQRANVGTRVRQEMHVWDAQTGQELHSLNEQSDDWIFFRFSPDGKRLAIVGQRAKLPRIKVCDTETGQELFTFQRHTDVVNSLAFSPDSKLLATGSEDKTLRLWDLQTGDEIQTLKGHTSGVLSVAFSPDGQRLASADRDSTARVWDVRKDPETFSLAGGPAAVSPDLKRLASASGNNWVRVWDAHSGQETLTLKGHTNKILSLTFSPDGKRLASGDGTFWGSVAASVPGVVKVWDAQTGQEILTFKGHTDRVDSVAFSPDGRRLASGRGRGEVKVWDAQTGQELLNLKGSVGNPGDTIAFSHNGKLLASGGSEVKVWDAETGQELLSLQGGGPGVAFSPDGKRLASSSSTSSSWGTVRVWDLQTGQELLTFTGGKNSPVRSLAFTPDGKRLVSASWDRVVTVWDAQTGQELLKLKGGRSVVFSPDGHRLVSNSGPDRAVTIYDATPLPVKP